MDEDQGRQGEGEGEGREAAGGVMACVAGASSQGRTARPRASGRRRGCTWAFNYRGTCGDTTQPGVEGATGATGGQAARLRFWLGETGFLYGG